MTRPRRKLTLPEPEKRLSMTEWPCRKKSKSDVIRTTRKCKSRRMSSDREPSYYLRDPPRSRQTLLEKRRRKKTPKLWRMTAVRKRSTRLNKNGTMNNRRRTTLTLEPKTSRERKPRWN